MPESNSFDFSDLADLSNSSVSKNDPWTSSASFTLSSDTKSTTELSFKDSFVTQTKALQVNENNKNSSSNDTTYIPLEDSESYLANLIAKVNKQTGLLEALSQSKEDHTYNFLRSGNQEGTPTETLDESSDMKVSLNSVDPKGTLGAVMRKLVPDHVAVSAEELCELLKADILSKIYDEQIAESEKESNATDIPT